MPVLDTVADICLMRLSLYTFGIVPTTITSVRQSQFGASVTRRLRVYNILIVIYCSLCVPVITVVKIEIYV